MKGNTAMQQTKGIPSILEIVAELRKQGWRVEHGNGKWSAYPPDRSLKPVFFRRLDDGRETKNVLGWLRNSGFIWHEIDAEKPLSLVEDAPASAPASKTAFVVPDAWSQPKTSEEEVMTLEEEVMRDVADMTAKGEETFGQALQRIRRQEGSDKETVAKLMDLTESAVTNWESGWNYPTLDHYNKLLVIFPELANAAQPPALRDMLKPGRPVGAPYRSNPFAPATAEPLPPITETKLITMPEESDTMNQPKPVLAVATHTLIDKALLVRLIKLSIAAKAEDSSAMMQLLREAREAHLTITDVLDILES